MKISIVIILPEFGKNLAVAANNRHFGKPIGICRPIPLISFIRETIEKGGDSLYTV